MAGKKLILIFVFLLSTSLFPHTAFALSLGVVPDKIEVVLDRNSCVAQELTLNNPSNKTVYYSFEKNDFFKFSNLTGKINRFGIKKISFQICSHGKTAGNYTAFIFVRASNKISKSGNEFSAGIGIKAEIRIHDSLNQGENVYKDAEGTDVYGDDADKDEMPEKYSIKTAGRMQDSSGQGLKIFISVVFLLIFGILFLFVLLRKSGNKKSRTQICGNRIRKWKRKT
ncbi:MAG TPA: hypothetical protein VI894_01680 [Candidatus Nanoarchaeia archaeon]|nr:hypothetical protein [Candidatus Nanoarchaeia archaeon]